MEDRELLREYLERHSEQAFGELVARHVNLVYSAALRVVGEPQMAQDAAQATFIVLARKAHSLRNHDALGGWLYRAACNAAATLVRSEQRRRRREIEAVNRAELDANPQGAWEAIAPLLEDAMRQLKPAEQDALVLRYFQSKSLREAGRALALSEDAMQKRVSRALEKLRSHLAVKGVAVPVVLLAAALSAHAAQAAPSGLASVLAASSLAGAGTATVGAWAGFFKLLVMTKLEATALGLLFVAGMVTPVLLNSRAAAPARAPVQEAATPKRAQASSARQPGSGPAPTAAPAQASPALARLEAWLRQNDFNNPNWPDLVGDLRTMVAALSPAEYPRAWALREGVHAHFVRSLLQQEVLRAWGETDPKAAATAAQYVPLDWRGFNAVDTVLWNWGARDPKAALAWAQQSLPEGMRLERMREAINGMARTDPAGALVASRQLLTPGLSMRIVQSTISDWASKDPVAAAAAVTQMAPSPQRAAAFEIMVREWKEQDPEAAQRWLDQTSLAEEKQRYLQLKQPRKR